MLLNWGAGQDSWKSLGQEINPEYSLEGMLLKLQYFGHLMQRANSLEKTLMLGKIEGKRRREQQWMRWWGSITDSMDMSLSKLQEIVKDREARCAIIHGVAKCWGDLATEKQQQQRYQTISNKFKATGQEFSLSLLIRKSSLAGRTPHLKGCLEQWRWCCWMSTCVKGTKVPQRHAGLARDFAKGSTQAEEVWKGRVRWKKGLWRQRAEGEIMGRRESDVAIEWGTLWKMEA